MKHTPKTPPAATLLDTLADRVRIVGVREFARQIQRPTSTVAQQLNHMRGVSLWELASWMDKLCVSIKLNYRNDDWHKVATAAAQRQRTIAVRAANLTAKKRRAAK